MKVRVVFAHAEAQFSREIELESGSCVEQALQSSGLFSLFPEASKSPVGVHGRVVERTTLLAEGDRVEVYRPLCLEPKQARLARIKSPKA